MAKICRHVTVSGKVQGVWFRDSTQKEAQTLGITGWIRNVPSGEVELVACAEEQVLNTFCRQWLWEGPPAAEVEEVSERPIEYEAHEGFTIR